MSQKDIKDTALPDDWMDSATWMAYEYDTLRVIEKAFLKRVRWARHTREEEEELLKDAFLLSGLIYHKDPRFGVRGYHPLSVLDLISIFRSERSKINAQLFELVNCLLYPDTDEWAS